MYFFLYHAVLGYLISYTQQPNVYMYIYIFTGNLVDMYWTDKQLPTESAVPVGEYI